MQCILQLMKVVASIIRYESTYECNMFVRVKYIFEIDCLQHKKQPLAADERKSKSKRKRAEVYGALEEDSLETADATTAINVYTSIFYILQLT